MIFYKLYRGDQQMALTENRDYSASHLKWSLELSDDDFTRKAIQQNGFGPSTCKDLQRIGHILNGFYFLRHNITTIKTTYCKLNETERKPKKKKTPNTGNELSSSTQLTTTFLGKKLLLILSTN